MLKEYIEMLLATGIYHCRLQNSIRFGMADGDVFQVGNL